jgi:hypothetical protein
LRAEQLGQFRLVRLLRLVRLVRLVRQLRFIWLRQFRLIWQRRFFQSQRLRHLRRHERVLLGLRQFRWLLRQIAAGGDET